MHPEPVSESAVVSVLTDALPRPPGKPKGYPRPPGAGRAKGTRNKVTREIRAIAQRYTPRGLQLLWKMSREAADEEVRLKALALILAYAHGKPIQATEISGPDGKPIASERVSAPISADLVAGKVAEMLALAKKAGA